MSEPLTGAASTSSYAFARSGNLDSIEDSTDERCLSRKALVDRGPTRKESAKETRTSSLCALGMDGERHCFDTGSVYPSRIKRVERMGLFVL